jgi:hypothetical protein
LEPPQRFGPDPERRYREHRLVTGRGADVEALGELQTRGLGAESSNSTAGTTTGCQSAPGSGR